MILMGNNNSMMFFFLFCISCFMFGDILTIWGVDYDNMVNVTSYPPELDEFCRQRNIGNYDDYIMCEGSMITYEEKRYTLGSLFNQIRNGFLIFVGFFIVVFVVMGLIALVPNKRKKRGRAK